MIVGQMLKEDSRGRAEQSKGDKSKYESLEFKRRLIGELLEKKHMKKVKFDEHEGQSENESEKVLEVECEQKLEGEGITELPRLAGGSL